MDDKSVSPLKISWREITVLAALLGLGLAVRTHQIDYNFDGDEVFSAQLASRPFSEVITYSLLDRPHPPLHNILLHFWINAFGPSEASTRMMSVVFSMGFLLLAFLLFRRVMRPYIALAAIAILVSSPFMIYYGQQNRPYALIMFLATANMLAFTRVLAAPEQGRRVMVWALSCVILLHAQYPSGLLILMEMAFASLALREHRRKIILSGIASIALLGPWVFTSMYECLAAGVDPLPHISWMTKPQPVDFCFFYLSTFGFIASLPASLLVAVLAIAGSWFLYRTLRTKRLEVQQGFLLVVALGIPSAMFVISTLGPKPIFEGRQMLTALIAFVGVTGMFASSLGKGADAAFLGILACWTMAAAPQAFPVQSKPPWREIAAHVDVEFQSEPVVVLEKWVLDPVQHYRGPELGTMLQAGSKKDAFLLLTRPHLDKFPESEGTHWERVPLQKWHWGDSTRPAMYSELTLYRVTRSHSGNVAAARFLAPLSSCGRSLLMCQFADARR